jgi:hypothetical protein
MRPADIEIERREEGIYAHVRSAILGKGESVLIWSRLGRQADEYREMSDDEIRAIAFEQWNRMNTSRLRRKGRNGG